MTSRHEGPFGRRDPFETIQDAVQRELERWWDRDFFPWRGPRTSRAVEPWAPRVDVYDDGDAIVVDAELPGIGREDVEVTIEDNDLVLRGERKRRENAREDRYLRMERNQGPFFRRLPLPFPVSPDAVSARFIDGVLQVRLPKPSGEQPGGRRIEVQA